MTNTQEEYRSPRITPRRAGAAWARSAGMLLRFFGSRGPGTNGSGSRQFTGGTELAMASAAAAGLHAGQLVGFGAKRSSAAFSSRWKRF